MSQWIFSGLIAWAWGYLADNYVGIALFLIAATAVCIAVRKLIALYGHLPLIIGVVLLIVAAWALGYRSGPVRVEVRTVTHTKTVEVPVIDNSEINRLSKRLAERDAAIAQAEAARRNAEAALAQLRQELAGAKNEIQRLLAELAKPPTVVALVEEFNAQCPKCAYLMNVGEGMRNEQIRCRHCGLIMSAKTAWARRAFVLSRQKGQR
jgi:hypothetical protein